MFYKLGNALTLIKMSLTSFACASILVTSSFSSDAVAQTKSGFSACIAINEKDKRIFASSIYPSDDGRDKQDGDAFALEKGLNKPGTYDPPGTVKNLILACKWAKTEIEVKDYLTGIRTGSERKNFNYVGVSWAPTAAQ
jgi:hypothetical protein